MLLELEIDKWIVGPRDDGQNRQDKQGQQAEVDRYRKDEHCGMSLPVDRRRLQHAQRVGLYATRVHDARLREVLKLSSLDPCLETRFDIGTNRHGRNSANEEDRPVFPSCKLPESLRAARAEASKHRLPPQDELPDIRNPEKRPPENDNGKHVDMLQYARQLFDQLSQKEFLANEKRAVVDTPEHEVPCRAMPKASYRPDHRDIKYPTRLRHATSAQWDVEIIAEER